MDGILWAWDVSVCKDNGRPCHTVLAEVQELLLPGGFAIGDWFTIANTVIAPFLGDWEVHFCNDIGRFAKGMGTCLHEVLFQSKRSGCLQKVCIKR